jgi:lysophospholipase L1-like esterase
MSTRSVVLAALTALAIPCAALAADGAAKVPELKKGDKIIFLGDSITDGGRQPKGYCTLVQKAIEAKMPDAGITFVNAGISGNKVPDVQGRLQKDVLDKKPTLVFIYIGINDVWHWNKQADGTLAGGTPKDKYEAGLKEVIGKIKDAGACVILCTPSVIGEKAPGTNERDKMLDEYSDISRAVAKETGVQLVDLHKAFQDYERANNKEDKDRGVLTTDSCHLSDAGNQLVADQMLAALGLAPTAEKK